MTVAIALVGLLLPMAIARLLVFDRLQTMEAAIDEVVTGADRQRLLATAETLIHEIRLSTLAYLDRPEPVARQAITERERALADATGSLEVPPPVRLEEGRFAGLSADLLDLSDRRRGLEVRMGEAFDDAEGTIDDAGGNPLHDPGRLDDARVALDSARSALSSYRLVGSSTRQARSQEAIAEVERSARVLGSVAAGPLEEAAAAARRLLDVEREVHSNVQRFEVSSAALHDLMESDVEPAILGGIGEGAAAARAAVESVHTVRTWTLVGIALATLVTVFAARSWVVGRLRRLARLARQGTEVIATFPVEDPVHDEITDLTLALRAMARGSVADHAELRRLNHRLEARNVELQELDRFRDEMVSGVTHELQSPLATVVAYLEVLLEEIPGPLTAEQRDFLQVIDRSSGRLRRTVDDLLLLARIDAGLATLERSSVDLSSLVAQAVDDARLRTGQEGIALEAVVEPVGVLDADPARIGQVVDNLLSNAIKFTPPGGTIVVRVHQQGGMAVVEVEDTGIGIPAEEQAAIFNRFVRSSISSRASAKGSGIGLAIVEAIVDAHGGSVNCSSDVGVGTVFRVELPHTRAGLGAAAVEVGSAAT